MPVGMALVVLALAPAAAHILTSRLRPAIAIPLAAFLFLIAAVPINLGEGVTALSFAKFYNRIGWAALGLLLVMYLRPRRAVARQGLLDALCAAFLTLVMIYTKITYGAVALAFLVFMLSDSRQWRWALGALATTLVTALVVEVFWQASLAHLEDLILTSKVSGSLRGTWGQIIDHILVNFADYVLLTLIAGIALWCRPRVRDFLFYAFCAVSGFLLINQNFQAWGIIIIHAAAAVAAEKILRASPDTAVERAQRRWSVGAGAQLLFLALVLPTIIHCALALGLHAAAASTRSGEEIALPNVADVRLVNLWTWGDHDAAREYITKVREGVDLLASLDSEPAGVLVLDTANPFSVALGLQPPAGGSAWLQWERSVNATHFISAEVLLAGVTVIMEPKGSTPDTATAPPDTSSNSLPYLYTPYIAAHYNVAHETEHWRVHVQAPAQTSCIAGCGTRPVRSDSVSSTQVMR
jgi:hypothetical protein